MKKYNLGFIKILIVATVSFFVTGCGSSKNEVDSKSPQAIQKKKWEMAMPKFSLMNEDIKRWLLIEDLNFNARESDGFILVNAKFKSNSSFSKEITYKIIWFDKDGLEFETIMSRPTSVKLLSDRYFTISGVSPSEKVKDFRIEIYEN